MQRRDTKGSPNLFPYNLGLLGKIMVWCGGEDVPLTTKRVHVLAVLAAARNAWVTVDELADAIWLGSPPRSHRNVIHGYVRDLRQATEPIPPEHLEIVTQGTHYSLRCDPTRVDADCFNDLVTTAEECLRHGDLAGCTAALHRAHAIWRGPALMDARNILSLSGLVAGLEARRLASYELMVEVKLRRREFRDAVVTVLPLLHEYPHHELLHQHAMLALHQTGRRPEALRVFAHYRRMMVDELGIEPGGAIQRVHQMVLRDRVIDLRDDPGVSASGHQDQRPVAPGSARGRFQP